MVKIKIKDKLEGNLKFLIEGLNWKNNNSNKKEKKLKIITKLKNK